MTAERQPELSAPAQAAVRELQGLISQQYPDATFRVARGLDDPQAIHLVATVDVADRGAVLDTVLERMMELQIEQELPIFVVPVRPRARVLAMQQEEAQRRARTHLRVLPPQP